MTTDEDRATDAGSLLSGVNCVLAERWTVLVLAIVFGAAAGLTGLGGEATYEATATFLRGEGPDGAGLAGLGDLGRELRIALEEEPSPSPAALYTRLVETEAFRRRLVRTEMALGEDSEVPYWEAVGFGDRGPRAGVERAARALRGRLSATRFGDSGLIILRARASRPEVARWLADRGVDVLDRFLVELRRARAARERRFLEGELERVRAELQAAGDSLVRPGARSGEGPSADRRVERLQSEAEADRALAASLALSLAEARIRERRTTPALTVVHRPTRAIRQSTGRPLVRLLLGLLTGAALGIAWALGRGLLERERERVPAVFARYEELKREIREEIGGLWRKGRG